jgi:hypothetical protein
MEGDKREAARSVSRWFNSHESRRCYGSRLFDHRREHGLVGRA